MNHSLLTLLWAIPLAGAVLLLLIPSGGDEPPAAHDSDSHELRVSQGPRDGLFRWLALVISIAVFALTLLLWYGFDSSSAEFQFVERVAWIPAFGIDYYVGVDGISLLLIVLTGFLTPISLLSSWAGVTRKVKEFAIFILALEAAMMGVFISLDLFLFYVFWDAMLIPMYFLIGIWGYDQRIYAAIKFMLYTMAGSVLMLVAILALAYMHSEATGSYTFDLLKLYSLQIAPETQRWLFLAFALAFAIKVPLFPFHTWLPDAHVQAPTAGSVILAGVLLKMGTYGLVRFAFPLFPAAAAEFAPWIAALAVIGIVYGALVAMVQPDMKKLVAYSSVSHLGFVVLGICAMNVIGVQGAMYQMLAHGISTGGLFFMVGMLSDRRHTRAISEYGGLKGVVPRMTAAFVIITLASIGMPGLNGFIGEFLIMLGAFRWDARYVVVAGLGVILSAVYMLWMVQRVYYGKVTRPENAHLQDVTVREWAGLAPLCVMALVMGIVPTLFTKPMEPAVRRIVERVQGVEPVQVNNGMQNSKFKMQTASRLPERGDVDLAAVVSPR
jgi:NADH-quinone oxidoreductase subunit M